MVSMVSLVRGCLYGKTRVIDLSSNAGSGNSGCNSLSGSGDPTWWSDSSVIGKSSEGGGLARWDAWGEGMSVAGRLGCDLS